MNFGTLCDNCPDIRNDGQENADDDEFGDACDPGTVDTDGDGIDDCHRQLPLGKKPKPDKL